MSDLAGETTSSVQLAALIIADWNDRGYTVGTRDERAAIAEMFEAAADQWGRKLVDLKSGPPPLGPAEEIAHLRNLAYALGASTELRKALAEIRRRDVSTEESA
jgi:hypothetical protein